MTCPESFASSSEPAPPPRGLSRAELYDHARAGARVAGAVGSGVALAIALSCCNHNDVYGAPSVATHDAAIDDPGPLRMYGAPPIAAPEDAGTLEAYPPPPHASRPGNPGDR